VGQSGTWLVNYAEPVNYSSCDPAPYLSIDYCPLRQGLRSGSFLSGFPVINVYAVLNLLLVLYYSLNTIVVQPKNCHLGLIISLSSKIQDVL
jgi:hypothetical protein